VAERGKLRGCFYPGQRANALALGYITMNSALLIIDHGSRRQDANDLLPEIARMLREMSGFKIVQFAHMELAEPTIQQGFDACVAAGAEEVIVHPYFLGPGVAEAAAKHQGVSFRITEPLGIHPKIGELILERVSQISPRP